MKFVFPVLICTKTRNANLIKIVNQGAASNLSVFLMNQVVRTNLKVVIANSILNASQAAVSKVSVNLNKNVNLRLVLVANLMKIVTLEYVIVFLMYA